MAATAAGNLVTTTRLVNTYYPVFVDEVFGAINSGLVRVDNAPPFPASGANSYNVPGLYHTTAAAQTPTANTEITVKNLASNEMIGVIRRRAEALGFENAGAKAGSIGEDQLAQDIAKTLTKQQLYDIETSIFTYLIPGVISADAAVLNATHCVNKSSDVFDEKFIADAMLLMGEHIGVFNTITMHPTLFWKAQINKYLTAQANTTAADAPSLSGLVASYVGNIGSLRVFLNERCYNTGGVYETVLSGPGGVYMGIENAGTVEYERKATLAAGTDVWVSNWSNSVHIMGASFTGTAPTVAGGVTDAALATTTNWTAVTGRASVESPIVVIKAKAE